jgi:hypothetical protein
MSSIVCRKVAKLRKTSRGVVVLTIQLWGLTCSVHCTVDHNDLLTCNIILRHVQNVLYKRVLEFHFASISGRVRLHW